MAKPRNRRNHYRVLHVQPEAPAEIIKASYRTLMSRMKMHPDLGGDTDEAALINEAYAVLSDPQRRSAYDRQLEAHHPRARMRQNTGASTSGPLPTSAPVQTPNGSPRTGRAGSPGASPSVTAARPVACLFCGAQTHPPQCHVCTAPLNPVRGMSFPNFQGHTDNRRGSQRRERDHQAVALLGSPQVRHTVRWHDLSATGLSVYAPMPLAAGARLLLVDHDLRTVAEVVSCEKVSHGSPTWLLHARMLTLAPIKSSGLFCSTKA